MDDIQIGHIEAVEGTRVEDFGELMHSLDLEPNLDFIQGVTAGRLGPG